MATQKTIHPAHSPNNYYIWNAKKISAKLRRSHHPDLIQKQPADFSAQHPPDLPSKMSAPCIESFFQGYSPPLFTVRAFLKNERFNPLPTCRAFS
jgi:hypothetical protein